MKKQKNFALLAISIPVAIAVLFEFGLACEIKQEKKEAPAPCDPVISREYEFDLEPDSIILYDGSRFVGKVAINWDEQSPLDSLLLKDNE